MKPKHHFHHIQLALMGIPLLLLSPAAHGKDQDKEEKAAEVAETEETAEENGNARRAKEAVEEATKEAAKRAEKEAAVAKEAAEKKVPAPESIPEVKKAPVLEKVPEPAPQPPADKPVTPAKSEAVEKPEKPEPPARGRGRGRGEAAPGSERPPATQGRERGDRPTPPTPPVELPIPPAVPSKPPVDMPVVPSAPLVPKNEGKVRGKDPVPGKEVAPAPIPEKPVERKIVEIPATEPERVAETQVTEVTRAVQLDLDQRKTRIEGRDQARALIDDILGAESRISRAEVSREERFRPRFERQTTDQERQPAVSPDQRRAATTYFEQRLRGRAVEGPQPEFFIHSQYRDDRRIPRDEERVVERVESVRPRYLIEGRRYVHFDSRAGIPAILMAAEAMNHVRFQPAREIDTILHERQGVSATHGMPLPPENYRGENSWVVSYPVDEKSMISSEDILFLQGSTQFADPYSYEVIGVLAAAMKEVPEEERFVIEGHASAEGSYESNMVLSQQRAEHIVREIVRRGVSPYRLLPVGYGESEARQPADGEEALRGRDRRVVVFRMKPEAVAKR